MTMRMTETARVAPSEHDIVFLARALVGDLHQRDAIWPLLASTRKLPPHVGETCGDLLDETLRQTWLALWRRAGARPATGLTDGGAVVRGRPWERHEPETLSFTGATVALLRWLVGTNLAGAASRLPSLDATPGGVGDQVIVFLALDATAPTPGALPLANQPLVRQTALAWLGFPDLMATAHPGAPPPPFDSLTAGVGAIVVETLTGDIARRWTAVDIAKRSIVTPDSLIQMGATQDAILGDFMASCDRARRRDLASFVIDAVLPLVTRDLSPAPERLDPTATLGQRNRARLGAGALLRAASRWDEWDQQHRATRFIDDGYAAAQFLLSRYEPMAGTGRDRIAGWLHQLAQL
jgi:hypothetical protein